MAHRLVKKHSLLISKRCVSVEDIKVAMVTGSDIYACLNAIQAHTVHSSFVYLKEIVANMIRDEKFRGRPEYVAAEDGQMRRVRRSVGPGLVSQTEGGEKNNGYTTSATFMVNREHDKVWPGVQQHQDFGCFVAESAFPQQFKVPATHSRMQSRFGGTTILHSAENK